MYPFPNPKICKKDVAEECIFDHKALYCKYKFHKNALLHSCYSKVFESRFVSEEKKLLYKPIYPWSNLSLPRRTAWIVRMKEISVSKCSISHVGDHFTYKNSTFNNIVPLQIALIILRFSLKLPMIGPRLENAILYSNKSIFGFSTPIVKLLSL